MFQPSKTPVITAKYRHLDNSHDFVVPCMLYWIHLVVCERLMLRYIVYFLFLMYFSFFFFWHSNNLITRNQHNFWKPYQNMCSDVLDFYMKIINNKHTLLYNLPTIHWIQWYNGLCELFNWLQRSKEFHKLQLSECIDSFCGCFPKQIQQFRSLTYLWSWNWDLPLNNKPLLNIFSISTCQELVFHTENVYWPPQ